MALPLAFAILAVPAKADLTRGDAEFLRGHAHCDAREISDRLVLARLGRAKPSLQTYEALIRADSANAVAWTRKGQLLEELNKFDEAVDAYNAATAQDPHDGDAWTGLGDALYALERYEEAVEAYDRAIAADPNNEEAWNNKGFTFFMLGIHEEALACYEKALAINPRYKQAWYNKGYTFHGINRLEEAVTAYEKAIETDRGDEAPWNNLGNALYHLGRLEEARDALNNTLILNGSFDEAWVFRGKILEEMGNALEAERCYEEALQCFYASLEIEPDNAELRYHQAVLLEDLERVDEAIDGYAASASKAHGADALIRLSALLLRVGRPGDAIADCDAAIRATEIGRDLVHRRKGELLLRLNRPKEAVAAFDAAIGLNPTDPETWCDAARAWRALGQEARARKMVDQALRLDPTSSQALDMRSEGAASS